MIDGHERFRESLAPWLAELLPPSEAAWMDAHAAECQSCRNQFERVCSRLPDLKYDAGHTPVSLLEVFVSAPTKLTPLERRLVTRHIASCEVCRGDAEELAAARRVPRPIVPITGAARHHLAPYGLLAAAALTAVFLLLPHAPWVRVRTAPPVREPARAPSEHVTPPPPTSPPPKTSDTRPVLVLLDHARGAPTEAIPAIDLHRDETVLRTKLPPVFMDPDEPVALLVEHAEGERVLERALSARALQQVLELTPEHGAWRAGGYLLHIVPGGGRDTTATRTFEFMIRLRR